MGPDAVAETQRERVEPPRVLLVEDERELGEMLARLLQAEGFAVDLAADGHAGLHLGLTRHYHLLLVDRRLPAIEGLELLGRLRFQGVTARALVLTARGSVGDRVAGLDAGADDYLTKPFAVEELLARLRALLRRHEDTASRLDLGGRSLSSAAGRCGPSAASATRWARCERRGGGGGPPGVADPGGPVRAGAGGRARDRRRRRLVAAPA